MSEETTFVAMLTTKALRDLTKVQKELKWTNEEKYRVTAREVISFERDELSLLQSSHRSAMIDSMQGGQKRKQPDYTSLAYWDTRYAEMDMTYDWLLCYEQVEGVVEKFVKTTDRILVPGCGNSLLSFGLYDHGYKDTVSIDNSAIVIDQMKKRLDSREDMVFEVMDACRTSFNAEEFDVIFDKSLFDCLVCGKADNVIAYIEDMNRVLKTGGLLIVLSLHASQAVGKHLSGDAWTVLQVGRVENPSYSPGSSEAQYYWVSVCKKIADVVPSQCLKESATKSTDDGGGPASEIKSLSAKARDELDQIDVFEPADRRTLGSSPVFTGAPGRDLFESEEWMDLNDVVSRALGSYRKHVKDDLTGLPAVLAAAYDKARSDIRRKSD